MTTEQVIMAFTPIVILGVTWLINYAAGKMDGRIVIALVPVLTLIASYVTSLIKADVPFWGQVGCGLIATFLYEFVKQWKPKQD